MIYQGSSTRSPDGPTMIGPIGPPPLLPRRPPPPPASSTNTIVKPPIDPSVLLPGIGVFGTGDIVCALVPLLRANGFKVEAIWGSSLDAAESLSHQLDIPFYTDRIDEVLLRKDVDLVCIMCPPNLHSQIAVKALGIGKHVLCDRPAGLCQTDVLKMVRAAQYYPSLISVVGHWLRFLPAFSHMRRAVRDGYVGEVTVCDVRMQCGGRDADAGYDWTCSEAMGGGVLATFGSHVIDIVSHVTEQRAVRVHGMLRTFRRTTSKICGIRQIGSDDFCSFQMEMSGGACVTVSLNDGLPGQFVQEVLVCGQLGHLLVCGGRLYGRRLDAGQTGEELLYSDSTNDERVTIASTSTSMTNGGEMINCGPPNVAPPLVRRIDAKSGGDIDDGPAAALLLPLPYLRGLVETVSALREAFAPLEDKRSWVKEPVEAAATFEDGQYIQAVVDAIRRANRNREWVKVKLQTEEVDPNPFLSAAVRRSIISQ